MRNEVNSSSTEGTFTFAKTGQTIKAFMRDSTRSNVKLTCYVGLPVKSSIDGGMGTFTRTVISQQTKFLLKRIVAADFQISIREKAVNDRGIVLEDSTYEMLGFKK